MKLKLSGTDKKIIEIMVNKKHVSSTDEDIINYVRSRMHKIKAAYPSNIYKPYEKMCLSHALKIHRRNKGLFDLIYAPR